MDNVLLVGSGGREHAIAEALVRHGGVRLFVAMAHANPGVARLAEVVLRTETDVDQIVRFAREHEVDFCVVGPEAPLGAGLCDALESAGVPCASPSRAAARIETSKTFMRELLDRHSLPGRIRYLRTTDRGEARAFAEELDWRIAVKPVGLTSGKGVRVWGDHFSHADDVVAYIDEVLTTAVSGHAEVVLEELLEGQEFTLHFYCDGTTAVPSPPIQDHKRAFDGDKGPNTGGMGAYSCADHRLPFLRPADYQQATVIGQRVVDVLAAEGHPFRGILYGQFMVTAAGPKIIEFNARFGDPEAINALALLETPYSMVCRAQIGGTLDDLDLVFREVATVVLYVVPKGYGGRDPKAGARITVDESAVAAHGADVFYASCDLVAERDGRTEIATTSSRTLAVYAEAATTGAARGKALRAIDTLQGEFAWRTDIGSDDVLRAKAAHVDSLRDAG